MSEYVPPSALPHGFRSGSVSTHTSRTISLREASALFAATGPEASFEEMRHLVVEENVTFKATLATRKETFRRLSELYGLRRDLLLYRALRDLWDTNPAEQPVLALLCALARDPLLRSTASFVLAQPVGQTVTKYQMEEQVNFSFPDHFRPGILAGLGRRTLSSWEQSGHLAGRLSKVRTRPVTGPATVAYALLLGYLCEARGNFLFDTLWAKVLDVPASGLDALAFAASQRNWLDYRRLGDVCEIRFSYLMRS